MRRGELVGLRWSNIDFENSKIKIEEQATVAGIEQILKTTNSIGLFQLTLRCWRC